jgi:ABC-type amino acid transport substrate-binding protein
MTDIFEYIRNGSADTVAMGLEWSLDRVSNFSFSNPLYKVHTGFIVRQTGNLKCLLLMLFFREYLHFNVEFFFDISS